LSWLFIEPTPLKGDMMNEEDMLLNMMEVYIEHHGIKALMELALKAINQTQE